VQVENLAGLKDTTNGVRCRLTTMEGKHKKFSEAELGMGKTSLELGGFLRIQLTYTKAAGVKNR
jgi:hypothetical protein